VSVGTRGFREVNKRKRGKVSFWENTWGRPAWPEGGGSGKKEDKQDEKSPFAQGAKGGVKLIVWGSLVAEWKIRRKG